MTNSGPFHSAPAAGPTGAPSRNGEASPAPGFAGRRPNGPSEPMRSAIGHALMFLGVALAGAAIAYAVLDLAMGSRCGAPAASRPPELPAFR